MKTIDRSLISVVPVVIVTKKARIIATRKITNKDNAVFMLTVKELVIAK